MFPKDYKLPEPKGGKFMKLEDGANTFRVLSDAIIGFVYWTEDDAGGRKPVRVKTLDEVPEGHRSDAKHFWAMAVYNHAEGLVQVLELTQRTIQGGILALVNDEDWGEPEGVKEGYDIVVTKKGEKLKTEYSVSPKPRKALDEAIEVYYKDLNINLDRLYEGEDPFGDETSKKKQ